MTHDEWLRELPQQFQNKKNIEILIGAFSEQIDELKQVFEDLKFATTLEKAAGQNLRYIGDIMSMSLKDAQSILRAASEAEITDETYRKVLQYKAIQNSCDCTYYDIMDTISLLWDTSNVKYTEKPENPATIYIEMPEASIEGMDPAIGRVLAIKPGGVAMIYSNGFVTGVNISGIEKARVPRMVMGVGVKEETSFVQSATVGMKIEGSTERAEASMYFMTESFFLDGSSLLDGTKYLGNEKVEEVL